ncbi:alpha/beta hydrolase [Pseudochelatococcus sp. B33]
MLKNRILACALAGTLIVPMGLALPIDRAAAQQQILDITARSAVAAHDALKQTAVLPDFRIGGTYDLDDPASWENGGVGGVTLESLGADPLRLGYIALGTPKTDAEGRIINAVVIPSFYSGDSTSMYDQWVEGSALSGGPVVGPGKLIDTDRFYVVMFDAIGLWGASKPSDGLGLKFPLYSYYDQVQAQYRVLRDQLNVGRVALVTGVSMGGSQTHLWGVMHSPSGFVRAVMPIGGTTQEDGGDPVRAWLFQLATAALESDPVWKETGGDYYDRPKDQHPNQGVAFHWSVLSQSGFDLGYRATQPWETVKRDVFFWNPPTPEAGAGMAAMAQNFDAVDLLYRNRTGLDYNINDDLGRSRADTLVLHVKNDNWLVFPLAERAAERIPGARLIGEESPLSHYAVFGMPNNQAANPIFRDFLQTVAIGAETPDVELPDWRIASVAKDIDPQRSFWKEEITYPFPVKFTTGKDSLGREWQIGYMDEYAGKDPNSRTLVIIHGKGAFGAHYGNIMTYALAKGLRVVVPDLPSYGQSGPGNLALDESRSMANMREAIHDALGRIGVEKAAFFGHSMGGQFVLGYALNWPDQVESIILEGPAGLEEFPREVPIGGGETVDAFDPALANQGQKWREVWKPLGLFDAEFNRTPEEVEDFFNWRKRDAAGNPSPASTGYFLRETPYARLHTDQRIAMIKGNPREFDQWVAAFIWDIHSMVAENLKDDPDNLYRRLPQIKAPIFLTFGAREPFIPSTPLNGLTDMANEVITPFAERLAAAGNPPLVKVYPGAAHFIHTDEPVRYPRDVVDFVLTGKVSLADPLITDALINGTAKEAAAADSAGSAATTEGLSK